jgi:hypothetical protein
VRSIAYSFDKSRSESETYEKAITLEFKPENKGCYKPACFNT